MIGVTSVGIRSAATSTFDKGVRIPGVVSSTTYIQGSLQPYDGLKIKTMPDSVRERIKFALFTETALQSYDKAQPHQVQVNSEWFDVHSDEQWSVMLSHHKYYLCKIKEGD